MLNLHDSGALTAENCTLVSNAYGTAGAINLRAYAGGTATVCNAVIVSNAGAVAAGTEGVAHFTNSCVSSAQNIADFEAGGNITDDPLFVDFGSANFRLRGTSPCIDSGLGLSWMAFARDLDGNARIDRRSGVVDRGCYEHTDAGLLLTIR